MRKRNKLSMSQFYYSWTAEQNEAILKLNKEGKAIDWKEHKRSGKIQAKIN